jgi:hypothetical protein
VVFDLDGTLVDTAPDLHAHLNALLAEHGRPGLALDAVRPMIGNGMRTLIERGMVASGGLPAGTDLDTLFATYLRRYTAMPLPIMGRTASSSRPGLSCSASSALRWAWRSGAVSTSVPSRSNTTASKRALTGRLPIVGIITCHVK